MTDAQRHESPPDHTLAPRPAGGRGLSDETGARADEMTRLRSHPGANLRLRAMRASRSIPSTPCGTPYKESRVTGSLPDGIGTILQPENEIEARWLTSQRAKPGRALRSVTMAV